MNKNKFYKKLSSGIFYFSILLFIIAFNFSDNGNGGWQLQTLPFLNDRPLRDMTFTDSLTGYGVTKGGNDGDSDYVIKTTNGGEEWNIVYTSYAEFNRINFINSSTGFICGGDRLGHGLVLKTTTGGINWFSLNASFANQFRGMFVLSEDTIWLVDDNGFNGGVFRTVNGGINWVHQWSGYNPSNIYMINKDVGFFNDGSGGRLMKTLNGGFNWSVIPGQNGFVDMFFIDSIKGWKSYDSMRVTTDGGNTWNRQYILNPNSSMTGSFASFSNIGKDTIWGGGVIYEFPNLVSRGVINVTTNGGLNWFYQIPDTSFKLTILFHSNFYNSNTGWIYSVSKGIYTNSGGDSIFYPITSVRNEYINSPENFILHQNYPNPFNPSTRISYELKQGGKVFLKVYNSLGKEIVTLVDQTQTSGNYKVHFSGSGLSSGVYFYSLFIDNVRMNTKKMILLR